MNDAIRALTYLLKNRVYSDHEHHNKVPVIKDVRPYDASSCITLDNSSGSVELWRRYEDREEHVDGELNLYEVLVRKIKSDINIHVWANTEKEREIILARIRELMLKAYTDHYMFCGNYRRGECAKLKSDCTAETGDNYRAWKNKCPDPVNNDYSNIFTRFNLEKDECLVYDSFDVDDYNEKQIIRHSVIETTIVYYDIFRIGGKIAEKLVYDEKLMYDE